MKVKIKKKKRDSGSVSLFLDGEVNVYSVVKLKKHFMNEMKSSSDLKIDLSDVTLFDTSGFQLLIFLKREAETANKQFVLVNPSGEVRSVFDLYNEIL